MSGARIAQPETTFNNVPAQTTVGNTPHRVLVVGLQASGATATAGVLQPNILNDGSEKTLFGVSQISEMIRNFKKMNQLTRIDAIGIAEPSAGTAAAGKLTVEGTKATEAGEINVYIGSMDYPINVVAAKDDTAASFATKINTAIGNFADRLLVTASATAADVTITAKQKGAQGNNIGIRVDGTIPGLTVAITKMTGGAGTPDLTDLFDVVGNERYQTVIWPFFGDLDEVKDFLEARWNVKNNVLDGVAVTCSLDTHANQLTALGAMNEKTIVYLCNGIADTAGQKGGLIFESPENIAAQFSGMRALRYTENAVLTQFLTTNAGLDQFGGSGIAALPYFNTLMPYLPTVPQGQGYTELEVEQLGAAGGSCLGNNPTGTDVICGEIFTTYKTDPAGNADVTYKFLNYVDEQSVAREYFWNNVRKRFAQSRLTRGAIIPGRDMANEGVVRTFLLGLWGDLTGSDYTILQAGDEYRAYFKNNLVVTLDMAKGRISIQSKLCYVTQAREFLGTLEVVFDINGGQ